MTSKSWPLTLTYYTVHTLWCQPKKLNRRESYMYLYLTIYQPILWLQHVACSTYVSLRWCWPGPGLPGRFLKPLPCFHIPRQVFLLWQSLFLCRENKYIPHRIKPVTLHAHTCNLWIFEVSWWTLSELMTRLSTSLKVLFFPTFKSRSSQQSLELDSFFQKWLNNLLFSICLA